MSTKIETSSFSHPCIICFEPLMYGEYEKIHRGLAVLDRIFEKECDCKVYAHNYCLISWYKHRLLCPYCKSKVLYHRPSQVLIDHLSWFSHKCMTCMTIYTCIETILYLFENHIDSYLFQAFTYSTVNHNEGVFDYFRNNISQLKIE
jgi:hypothetical protein